MRAHLHLVQTTTASTAYYGHIDLPKIEYVYKDEGGDAWFPALLFGFLAGANLMYLALKCGWVS